MKANEILSFFFTNFFRNFRKPRYFFCVFQEKVNNEGASQGKNSASEGTHKASQGKNSAREGTHKTDDFR